jgi:hypothetical protein
MVGHDTKRPWKRCGINGLCKQLAMLHGSTSCPCVSRINIIKNNKFSWTTFSVRCSSLIGYEETLRGNRRKFSKAKPLNLSSLCHKRLKLVGSRFRECPIWGSRYRHKINSKYLYIKVRYKSVAVSGRPQHCHRGLWNSFYAERTPCPFLSVGGTSIMQIIQGLILWSIATMKIWKTACRYLHDARLA